MATILAVFCVSEVLKVADLIEVVLDLLNAPWRTVLDQILHRMQCLVDSTPLLRARLQPLPQMLHDLSVIIPMFLLEPCIHTYQLKE